jgi:hypothetical protein
MVPYEGPEVTWPEGMPVPPIGATVHFPDGSHVVVKDVAWYPMGSEDTSGAPFIYLVLKRPIPLFPPA